MKVSFTDVYHSSQSRIIFILMAARNIIPLAVGILSKLDCGDRGSPALPKDNCVEYNTGDSY